MIAPTLQELKDSIQQDIEQELGITAGFQKKTIAAFAAVMAAVLKTVYLAIAIVQKNIFVDTADSETTGGTLERFGRVFLGRNPNPATQGIYDVDVVGTIGGTIDSGVTFRDPLATYLYEVVSTVTLVATTGTVEVRSLTSGKDAELFEGSELVASAPIVNVESNAVVSAVNTEPEDDEDLEDYRAKIVQSIQLEPQGGSSADYRIWASDAASIKQVYPFSGTKSGILNLYAESNDATLIPSAAALAELETVIEADPVTGYGRRQVPAWTVNYLPVTPLDVDIIIEGLNDSGAGVITAIENALTNYLLSIRPFIGGSDDPNNPQDVLRLSSVNEVISNALEAGNFFTAVDLQVDGNSVTSFRFNESNVPILNSVSAI